MTTGKRWFRDVVIYSMAYASRWYRVPAPPWYPHQIPTSWQRMWSMATKVRMRRPTSRPWEGPQISADDFLSAFR